MGLSKPVRTLLRFIFVLVLFGVLFSYGMFQGGFVSWFLFFGFLPVLLYSLFLTFYPISWLTIERDFSRKYTEAGQGVDVELTIKRRFPFPAFYMILEDQLPETVIWKDTREKKYRFLSRSSVLVNRGPQKTIVFPWFKRVITHQYRLDHIPRGKHQFEKVKLVTGDFLGMVRKEKSLDVPSTIHVSPWERPIRINSEMSAFDEGAQTAFSPHAKHTNVVSSVRDYAPGDRVSWVDWKTTAKKQKLVTKEFEQEKHKDLSVLLNGLTTDLNRWLSFEASIELVNALVKKSLRTYGDIQCVYVGKSREEMTLTNSKHSMEKLGQVVSEARLIEDDSFHEQLIKETFEHSNQRNLMIVSHELNQKIGEALIRLSLQAREVTFVLIASKDQLDEKERTVITRLKTSQVAFTWLSEDQLMNNVIEVNA